HSTSAWPQFVFGPPDSDIRTPTRPFRAFVPVHVLPPPEAAVAPGNVSALALPLQMSSPPDGVPRDRSIVRITAFERHSSTRIARAETGLTSGSANGKVPVKFVTFLTATRACALILGTTEPTNGTSHGRF